LRELGRENVREIGYVFQGFLCVANLIGGKPRVVRRGSPLPQIPEAGSVFHRNFLTIPGKCGPTDWIPAAFKE
jgi:hypothetical protein